MRNSTLAGRPQSAPANVRVGYPFIKEDENTMRKVALGVALALIAGVAIAEDDPMANTYENTVEVTNAKGEVSKLHFNADKSYTNMAADGQTVKGTWAMAEDGSKICYTQMEPAPAPDQAQPACAPFLGPRNVGDTWKQAGTTGEEVTVNLVGGR
jgi:hypothetical protein